MNMSDRRAWLLIDALNRSVRQPVVATKLGGSGGGGAELTGFGRELIGHFRDMETAAHAALRPHLAALEGAVADSGPSPAGGETFDAIQAPAVRDCRARISEPRPRPNPGPGRAASRATVGQSVEIPVSRRP